MSTVINTLPEETKPLGPVEYLELTWEERCKPRRKFATKDGTELVLSLSRGTALCQGMTVYNTRERTVVVKAKPEHVIIIEPANMLQACQVAHNLGNWHRSMHIADRFIATYGDSPLEEWLNKHHISFHYADLAYEPNLTSHAHD